MSDHEPEPTGYPKHARTCLLSIHDAPEGSMPCTCGAAESGVGERMSDVSERTCVTCTHWKPPSERDGYGNAVTIHRIYPSPEYEAALQAEHDADRAYGECQAINLQAGTDLPFGSPLPLAVARDGSDYMATLYTQAEFGCALWSGHDESPSQPEG